jgi:hypothetical protein
MYVLPNIQGILFEKSLSSGNLSLETSSKTQFCSMPWLEEGVTLKITQLQLNAFLLFCPWVACG